MLPVFPKGLILNWNRNDLLFDHFVLTVMPILFYELIMIGTKRTRVRSWGILFYHSFCSLLQGWYKVVNLSSYFDFRYKTIHKGFGVTKIMAMIFWLKVNLWRRSLILVYSWFYTPFVSYLQVQVLLSPPARGIKGVMP